MAVTSGAVQRRWAGPGSTYLELDMATVPLQPRASSPLSRRVESLDKRLKDLSSPRWQSRHLGVQVVDPICESHKPL